MKNQQKGNERRANEAARIWEPRRQEIVALYTNGTASQEQMAQRYGVTLRGFQKVLDRMGIAPKSRGRRGSANGRYIDGTQSTIYRSMIDKTHCAKCWSTDQLLIHHRDHDHTNNRPDNLQVLCSPCHTSHHKREYWNRKKAGQF